MVQRLSFSGDRPAFPLRLEGGGIGGLRPPFEQRRCEASAMEYRRHEPGGGESESPHPLRAARPRRAPPPPPPPPQGDLGCFGGGRRGRWTTAEPPGWGGRVKARGMLGSEPVTRNG